MATAYRIRRRALALLAVALWPLARALAVSDVSPENAFAWGANVGWLNWRPDSEEGVNVGQNVCSGYIYSGNLGWINVGNGAPANGIQYSNRSASDFGVNVDSAGNLRGYAYGPNIGWVNFEASGNPRVDFDTGKLGGFVYGANVGWINLGDATFSVAIDSITAGADTDHDGIPDSWELSYAKDLSALSATGDLDQDGQTDLQEYLADTDPTDPNDHLQIVQSALSADRTNLSISWTSKPTRQYLIETRSDLDPNSSWTDVGLGIQPAQGSLTSRTFTVDTERGFFRVRAVVGAVP